MMAYIDGWIFNPNRKLQNCKAPHVCSNMFIKMKTRTHLKFQL